MKRLESQLKKYGLFNASSNYSYALIRAESDPRNYDAELHVTKVGRNYTFSPKHKNLLPADAVDLKTIVPIIVSHFKSKGVRLTESINRVKLVKYACGSCNKIFTGPEVINESVQTNCPNCNKKVLLESVYSSTIL